MNVFHYHLEVDPKMSEEEYLAKYEQEDFTWGFLSKMTLGDLDGEDRFVPGGHLLGKSYMQRIIRAFHRFLSSENCSGSSVLDFGCGPTIHPVMSASKYFSTIYMTEYSALNRRAVEMWKNGDPSFPFDWTKHFELVAQLEGSSAKEVENRLRSKIQGVYPCDLTADQPLGDFRPPPVDCLISVLVLSAIAKTPDSCSELIRKLTSFLKPGGVLLLGGIYNCEYYIVDGIRLHSFNYDESLLRSYLAKLGLVIEEYVEYPVPPCEFRNDGCSYYFLKARKKQQ